MSARLGRFLPRILKTDRRRGPRRLASRPEPEALDARQLLSSVTLTSTGPITALTVGDDGSFQVVRHDFSQGQVFPTDSAPGDAGIFFRQADGTVVGLDLASRLRSQALKTHSKGLHPLSLTTSDDGRSVLLVADNRDDGNTLGNHFTLNQVTTYDTGDDYFRVENTLRNDGTTPLTLDVFAAADIYLADSDTGIGYRDAPSGAVGAEDATHQYRIFIQPDGKGSLAPSHYQEGFFDDLWAAIGSGGHFDDSIDPDDLDDGAGLEWQAVTVEPGQSVKIAYYWSFGSILFVPPRETLAAQGLTFPATAGLPFDGLTATFTTDAANPLATDFEATIDWGDGSTTTPGAVIVSADAGRFEVHGSHTYALAGNYPVHITIQGPHGSSVIAQSTAHVVDSTPLDPGLSGRLDPASDRGLSDSDGITNQDRPTFRGLATPGSVVTLLAGPSDPNTPLDVLGQATAGADGSWTITAGQPLTDGSYRVFAAMRLGDMDRSITLFDPGQPLVIDTVGPRVIGLTVAPRRGQLLLSLRDDRSGLDPTSLAIPSPYDLTRRSRPRFQHFPLQVGLSALNGPNGGREASILLTTASGRIGHGLRYVLTASSSALRDMAGNPLDGEFTRSFPTGDGRPGGDFRAWIRTDGRKTLPLLPAGPLARPARSGLATHSLADRPPSNHEPARWMVLLARRKSERPHPFHPLNKMIRDHAIHRQLP